MIGKLPRYEVQTYTLCDGWVNCWTTYDVELGIEVPTTFDTRAEAEQEIKDHLQDVKNAVAAGDMAEEHSADDFRVVEIPGL